jgi:hypothetical protein
MGETLAQHGPPMPQTFFGPSKFLSYLGRIPAAEIFEFRFKDVRTFTYSVIPKLRRKQTYEDGDLSRYARVFTQIAQESFAVRSIRRPILDQQEQRGILTPCSSNAPCLRCW